MPATLERQLKNKVTYPAVVGAISSGDGGDRRWGEFPVRQSQITLPVRQSHITLQSQNNPGRSQRFALVGQVRRPGPVGDRQSGHPQTR